MGFNLEMFDESQLDKNLICLLCFKVVRDPIHCANCETLFCTECIANITVEDCPKCTQKFKLMKIKRNLRGILEEQQVHCLKCMEKMKLIDYIEKHEQRCVKPQQLKQSVNSTSLITFKSNNLDSSILENLQSQVQQLKSNDYGCSACDTSKLTKSQLINHEDDCPYFILQCPNQCGKFLYRHQFAYHIQEDCELKRDLCEFCKKLVPLKAKKDHQKKKCQYVKVKCSFKNCGQMILRKDLSEHWDVNHGQKDVTSSNMHLFGEKSEGCFANRNKSCLLF